MKFNDKTFRRAIRNAATVTFVVALTSLLGIEFTLFIACICISVFLNRRTIRSLNPRHANGEKIFNEGKNLSIPERVEVFELADSLSINKLRQYTSLFGSMAVQPKILVLRLREFSTVTPDNILVLTEVVRALSEDKVEIIFSEVDENIEPRMKKLGLVVNGPDRNIAKNIGDALAQAEEMLVAT